MEIEFWIVGQIVVDIIIFILLVVFLRGYLRHQKVSGFHRESVRQSRVLMDEMKEIAGMLEKNLQEKKRLMAQLFEEMESNACRAEKASDNLKKCLLGYSRKNSPFQRAMDKMEPTKKTVAAMRAKGLSKEEISRYLNIPAGELELILKLHEGSKKSEVSK
jgi:hypothetical protein